MNRTRFLVLALGVALLGVEMPLFASCVNKLSVNGTQSVKLSISSKASKQKNKVDLTFTVSSGNSTQVEVWRKDSATCYQKVGDTKQFTKTRAATPTAQYVARAIFKVSGKSEMALSNTVTK